RQGREALAQGVRSAAHSRTACRQGADAQVPARRAVGRDDRYTVFARLHAPAPAQDRDGPRAAEVPFDRDRHRISSAGPRMTSREAELPCVRRSGASMQIKDFLAEGDTAIDVKASDKGALLKALAARVASSVNLPAQIV